MSEICKIVCDENSPKHFFNDPELEPITFEDLEKPKLYPIKEIADFKNVIGFIEVLNDISKKKSIPENELLNYCNSLYSYTGLIDSNIKDTYELVHAISKKIAVDPFAKTYGSTYIYHYLLILKAYSKYPWENTQENEDFEGDFDMAYSYFITELSIAAKQGNYLLQSKGSRFGGRTIEDFITTWVFEEGEKDTRQVLLNLGIYKSLRIKLPDYAPLTFFKLFYEFREIIKLFPSEPIKIIEAIKSNNGNEEVETKLLLYWILVALNYKIGLIEWLNQEPGSGAHLLLLSKVLEIEAEVLDCFPFKDPAAPVFSIPETEQPLEPAQILEEVVSPFSLNKDKLSKADLLRILDTLYDGGFVNGPQKSKGKFMEKAGRLFGLNLSDYSNDLRAAKRAYPEQYLAIFEALKKEASIIIEQEIPEKQNKR